MARRAVFEAKHSSEYNSVCPGSGAGGVTESQVDARRVCADDGPVPEAAAARRAVCARYEGVVLVVGPLDLCVVVLRCVCGGVWVLVCVKWVGASECGVRSVEVECGGECAYLCARYEVVVLAVGPLDLCVVVLPCVCGGVSVWVLVCVKWVGASECGVGV